MEDAVPIDVPVSLEMSPEGDTDESIYTHYRCARCGHERAEWRSSCAACGAPSSKTDKSVGYRPFRSMEPLRARVALPPLDRRNDRFGGGGGFGGSEDGFDRGRDRGGFDRYGQPDPDEDPDTDLDIDLEEEIDDRGGRSDPRGRMPIKRGRSRIHQLSRVKRVSRPRYLIGMEDIDRAFGYEDELGVAQRSCNLLGGPPGSFKSTVLVEICAALCDHGLKCAIFSGEMEESLVSEYARRNAVFKRHPKAHELLHVIDMTEDPDIDRAILLTDKYDVSLIDSVGVFVTRSIKSKPGSPSQQRYIAEIFSLRCRQNVPKKDSLVRASFKDKRPHTAFLIAHETKKGDVNGPRALEHLVDATFMMEHFDPVTGKTLKPKYKKGFVRMLSAKNRFSDWNGEIDCKAVKGIGLVPFSMLEEEERETILAGQKEGEEEDPPQPSKRPGSKKKKTALYSAERRP